MHPKNIIDAFSPLLGMHVWCIHFTHGNTLSMEFGKPTLEIRQPNPESLLENFHRRRVTPIGEYSFLILNSRWSIDMKESSCTNLERKILNLDGQILKKITEDNEAHSCKLFFDLGGILLIEPSEDRNKEEDQWQLSDASGRHVCYSNGGVFSYEGG